MSPLLLFAFVFGYFIVLLGVAFVTSRGSNNETFFIGNKNSNWILVAFGMIGTSLSGVTFVSVPGAVGNGGAFYYFQLVIGYFIGYVLIAYVLLPLYYRLNLTSIYDYLKSRFGLNSYKAGATLFILSRTIGATARLYLVINILQIFVFDPMEIKYGVKVSFWLSALVLLIMILLYTFEGGVRTIIFTDTLQTTFMLVGLVACIVYILSNTGLSFWGALDVMKEKNYSDVFQFSNFNAKSHFLKQVLGGMGITLAMTGLDQEMMQKNISVKKLGDSQKNMMSFSTVLLFVNFLFLFLGGMLYVFAANKGITTKGDDLFPTIALNYDAVKDATTGNIIQYNVVNYFPPLLSVIFIIGLISALFPSVDGAITALTSSFCIDILNFKTRTDLSDKEKKRRRLMVHLSFAIVFYILVFVFKAINNKSIIDVILKVAGFTYGPLLGMFAFGIFVKRKINDKLIWVICIASPLLIFGLDFLTDYDWYAAKLSLVSKENLESLKLQYANNFKIGNELIIYNAILTFLGLLTISRNLKIGESLEEKTVEPNADIDSIGTWQGGH